MYELFYRTEVNIICLLVLAWIAYRSKILSDKQTRRMMFQRVIVSTMVLMITDTLLIFTEGQAGSFLFFLNWLLNIIYLALNALVAFFWTEYIIYYIHGNLSYVRSFYYVSVIPIILFLLAVVTSPFTKFIFYINSTSNRLEKGPLFMLQVIITYGFFTSSSFVALVSLFRKKSWPSYYHRYVTFFSFLFLPLSGGILHVIFPEARIVWQGLSLGILLVYSEEQFDLISRDSLTGLNNRRAFDQKLKMLGEDYDEESQNHLFMIDINFFKIINDTYGHTEGDQALIYTADILKHILGNTNAFLSRYGGDEFSIIYTCNDEEAGALRVRLYKALDDFNKKEICPYYITVSVGYAPVCGSGPEAVKEAMKKADQELYDEKEFMHRALEEAKDLIKK
ncbi:MAG: diguanylate cyclase [Treponema sp.]|nr:diguanylate cyclase [Treponema sp.]